MNSLLTFKCGDGVSGSSFQTPPSSSSPKSSTPHPKSSPAPAVRGERLLRRRALISGSVLPDGGPHNLPSRRRGAAPSPRVMPRGGGRGGCCLVSSGEARRAAADTALPGGAPPRGADSGTSSTGVAFGSVTAAWAAAAPLQNCRRSLPLGSPGGRWRGSTSWLFMAFGAALPPRVRRLIHLAVFSSIL